MSIRRKTFVFASKKLPLVSHSPSFACSSRENCKNCKGFVPQKFCTIQYTIYPVTMVATRIYILLLWEGHIMIYPIVMAMDQLFQLCFNIHMHTFHTLFHFWTISWITSCLYYNYYIISLHKCIYNLTNVI